MTVTTGGRVWIPRQDRLPVNTFSVTIVRMACRTFFDDSDLVPLPRGRLVDVCMAVFALNLINKMGTRIMLCPFFLVTAMASHRLRVNSTSFCFQMGFHIRDVPVATVARVGAMDRLSEFPLTDLGMATKAFGIVNTLKAIFTSLDDKPLALFATFRRLGYSRGF